MTNTAPATKHSPLQTNQDTIAAIATAPGAGGIGVIRVSGHGLQALAQQLCAINPQPRHAHFATFRDEQGQAIDQGILLYFPAPHSFTGEEVLELQGHGGMVVLRLLLRRCLQLGARLAQAGEFSRRAFSNGKLDLTRAEAIADLINAGSESAARSAMRSLSGEFADAVHAVLEQVIALRTLVEATLDFPEEDIDFLRQSDADARLERITHDLAALLRKAEHGKLLQSGMTVVLAGEPNVGKSSLLNCLSGEDLAIVTPIAGTTRDTVRAGIQAGGVPLNIIDTAGLRNSGDTVEQMGIERSWRAIAQADVILLLVDARTGFDDNARQLLAQMPTTVPTLIVHNKIDLLDQPPTAAANSANTANTENSENTENTANHATTQIFLSARQRQGIHELERALLQCLGWQDGEDSFIARERHVTALKSAQQHLNAARECAASPLPALEIYAEELRLVQKDFDEITGEFSSDDLLGRIFSQFCMGK